jgi:hypothetical protein
MTKTIRIFGAMLLATVLIGTSANALRRENTVYFGIYNYAGQQVYLWVFFQTRLPDGKVIWDRVRHVVDHRSAAKLIGVKVTKGQLATCRGGIGTQRRDSAGKVQETRHWADLCKLYRVRLNSERAGPTKVYLDYNKQRDRDSYRDPWQR